MQTVIIIKSFINYFEFQSKFSFWFVPIYFLFLLFFFLFVGVITIVWSIFFYPFINTQFRFTIFLVKMRVVWRYIWSIQNVLNRFFTYLLFLLLFGRNIRKNRLLSFFILIPFRFSLLWLVIFLLTLLYLLRFFILFLHLFLTLCKLLEGNQSEKINKCEY